MEKAAEEEEAEKETLSQKRLRTQTPQDSY
jgi:hypothetical protein